MAICTKAGTCLTNSPLLPLSCLQHTGTPLLVPFFANVDRRGLSALPLVSLWVLFFLVGFHKLSWVFPLYFFLGCAQPIIIYCWSAANHLDYIQLPNLPVVLLLQTPSSCVGSYINKINHFFTDLLSNFLHCKVGLILLSSYKLKLLWSVLVVRNNNCFCIIIPRPSEICTITSQISSL